MAVDDNKTETALSSETALRTGKEILHCCSKIREHC